MAGAHHIYTRVRGSPVLREEGQKIIGRRFDPSSLFVYASSAAPSLIPPRPVGVRPRKTPTRPPTAVSVQRLRHARARTECNSRPPPGQRARTCLILHRALTARSLVLGSLYVLAWDAPRDPCGDARWDGRVGRSDDPTLARRPNAHCRVNRLDASGPTPLPRYPRGALRLGIGEAGETLISTHGTVVVLSF